MPRRVRRALLVALATLAGCSLAADPDGGACINSCYCHSSGSTAPPEPSPFLRPILASRGPRTLLGAAGIHPAGCFNSCTLLNAIYYNESKNCSTATGRCQSLGGIRSRRAWLSLPLSCAALSSALSRTTKRNFLSLILSRAAKRTFLSRSFPCNEMELFHPVLSRQRSAGLPEASKIL